MKRALLILALAITSLNCYSQAKIGTLARLDEKNGFRNIKLGTPFQNFKDLVHFNPWTYMKRNENLDFGNAKADAIYYEFLNNKLRQLTIEFNKNDAYAFEKVLTYLYGEPILEEYTNPYGYVVKYKAWHAKKVTLELHDTYILFTSTNWNQEFRKERMKEYSKMQSNF